MSPRAFYTNPIENLRSYIMVHGGLDRTERLQDVEWVEDLLKVTQGLVDTTSRLLAFAELKPENLEALRTAIQSVKEVMPKSRFSD